MSQVILPTTRTQPRLNIYGYNCIARHIALVVFICAPLFIGAGTFDWIWARGYSIATLIGWIILSLVLARLNPELLNERGKRTGSLVGTKRWDWYILGLYTLLLVTTPLLSGLDYRYGWSAPASNVIKFAGVLVLVTGFILLTWSMAVNPFFSGTVRIQNDHGHCVAAIGPYRTIRHPGYVAVALHFIAVPLTVGSWVALIPALLGVALFMLRTTLEDRTLIAELPGYANYARQTRSRWLPGVW